MRPCLKIWFFIKRERERERSLDALKFIEWRFIMWMICMNFRNIEFGFLAQVPSLVLTLISHVEEFLREFQEGSSDNGSGGGFGNLEKIENKLCRSCRRLNRAAENMIQVMERNSLDQYDKQDKRDNDESIYAMIEPPDMNNCFGEDYQSSVNEVVGGIVTVGNLFSQVVDLRLSRDLSALLDIVERGGRIPAKVALKSFATILADGGNHLCRLASEIRSVRGLLGVILEGGSGGDDYDKIISLRCLATILCVGEAVKDFDRVSSQFIITHANSFTRERESDHGVCVCGSG